MSGGKSSRPSNSCCLLHSRRSLEKSLLKPREPLPFPCPSHAWLPWRSGLGGGGGGLEEKDADRQSAPPPRQLPTDRGPRHQIHSPLHDLGRLTECGALLPKCPRHLLLCTVQQDTASATQDRGCRPPWRRSFRAVREEHAPRAPGRQKRGSAICSSATRVGVGEPTGLS